MSAENHIKFPLSVFHYFPGKHVFNESQYLHRKCLQCCRIFFFNVILFTFSVLLNTNVVVFFVKNCWARNSFKHVVGTRLEETQTCKQGNHSCVQLTETFANCCKLSFVAKIFTKDCFISLWTASYLVIWLLKKSKWHCYSNFGAKW